MLSEPLLLGVDAPHFDKLREQIWHWWCLTTSRKWLNSKLSRRDLAAPVISLSTVGMGMTDAFQYGGRSGNLGEAVLAVFYDVIFAAGLILVARHVPQKSLWRDAMISLYMVAFFATWVLMWRIPDFREPNADIMVTQFVAWVAFVLFLMGIHSVFSVMVCFSCVVLYSVVATDANVGACVSLASYVVLIVLMVPVVEYRNACAALNVIWAEEVMSRHSSNRTALLEFSENVEVGDTRPEDDVEAAPTCDDHLSSLAFSFTSFGPSVVDSHKDLLGSNLGRPVPSLIGGKDHGLQSAEKEVQVDFAFDRSVPSVIPSTYDGKEVCSRRPPPVPNNVGGTRTARASASRARADHRHRFPVRLNTRSRMLPQFSETSAATQEMLLKVVMSKINPKGIGCCPWHVSLYSTLHLATKMFASDCNTDCFSSKAWQCSLCEVVHRPWHGSTYIDEDEFDGEAQEEDWFCDFCNTTSTQRHDLLDKLAKLITSEAASPSAGISEAATPSACRPSSGELASSSEVDSRDS